MMLTEAQCSWLVTHTEIGSVYLMAQEKADRNAIYESMLEKYDALLKAGTVFDYGQVMCLNKTMVDLLLLSDERPNNEEGQKIKERLFSLLFRDPHFDFLGRHRTEYGKIIQHPVYARLCWPMIEKRLERDQSQGILSVLGTSLQHFTQDHLNYAESVLCYYAYGQGGLTVFSLIYGIEEVAIYNQYMSLHYFSDLAAGMCAGKLIADNPLLLQGGLQMGWEKLRGVEPAEPRTPPRFTRALPQNTAQLAHRFRHLQTSEGARAVRAYRRELQEEEQTRAQWQLLSGGIAGLVLILAEWFVSTKGFWKQPEKKDEL